MQENITITLPISNRQAVIKGYISASIDAEVQLITAQGLKTTYENTGEVDKDGKDILKRVSEVDPTAKPRAEKRTLELMVVSLDGSSSDVMTRLMELDRRDVNYIKEEINHIYNASQVSEPEKKESVSSTS